MKPFLLKSKERAGVKMTVFQESSEASELDKQLRIIGVPDKVDYARQLVNDLLTEKEIETVRLKTNATNRNMTNEYGTSRINNVEYPVPPQYIGNRPATFAATTRVAELAFHFRRAAHQT